MLGVFIIHFYPPIYHIVVVWYYDFLHLFVSSRISIKYTVCVIWLTDCSSKSNCNDLKVHTTATEFHAIPATYQTHQVFCINKGKKTGDSCCKSIHAEAIGNSVFWAKKLRHRCSFGVTNHKSMYKGTFNWHVINISWSGQLHELASPHIDCYNFLLSYRTFWTTPKI